MLPHGDTNQRCAKILIDNIDENFENIIVSVMTKEVGNLQHAVDIVTEWPPIVTILTKVHLQIKTMR